MTDDDDLVGQILLGKLEVIRKLGGGGMGDVYEVEHRLTGHRRALKVVQAKFADRPRFMKRLLREAKVAGTLGSRYVVETYDAGRLEDGSAYVLMELLHGRSLFEAMQQEGTLAPRRVARIMSQVAEGMSLAHAAGIVHRDLKPENIFLVDTADAEENVKILDFGVSKFEPTTGTAPSRLTVEGTLVGTPYYMSPEQAGGKKVDPRTDVYAMGVIMYEELTGRLPFEAESVGELFVKIGAGECVPLELRRPDIDAAWHELVHRAFHRDPERRYPTVEALRRDLLPLTEGGSTAARANTISDGARATLGFHEPLPPPPRGPGEPVIRREAVTRDAVEAREEGRALSAPPPPTDAARPSKRSSWLWATLGATLVVAMAVALPLSLDDELPATAEVATQSPSSSPPKPPAEPVEPVEVVDVVAPPIELPAAVADAGAPSIEDPPPSRRRPTPAGAAGLDSNPYR